MSPETCLKKNLDDINNGKLFGLIAGTACQTQQYICPRLFPAEQIWQDQPTVA